ncbi:MAG: hypothetical protein NT096_09185 [Proteobacteria bacterium]|nr:hypothetical protein [Pseudomonadota bacterium]
MAFLKWLAAVGVGFSIIAGGNLAWAECDCTKYPFKPDPPCFNDCCVRFLETASPEEVSKVLGLDRETAQKISEISPRGKAKGKTIAGRGPRSLEDYRIVLSPAEFNLLDQRLRSLSTEQFKGFVAPMREKIR